MTGFDRSRIATPDHPKSIIYAQLHQSLANYHATISNDQRGVSPQYQAFESRYKMNSSGSSAPTVDGNTKECIDYCNTIRNGSASTYIFPTPDYIGIEPVTLGGSTCYWVTHPSQHSWRNGRFIVHWHGGCNIFGSIYTHSGLSTLISKHFGMPVLFVDYRLAPEHPFPSQRSETLAVHNALLDIDSHAAERMIVMGESAGMTMVACTNILSCMYFIPTIFLCVWYCIYTVGGNLAVIHTQAVIDAKLPIPSLCISISPMSDSTQSGRSYIDNASTEIMMSPQQAQWYFHQCVGGKANADQLKSTSMNPLNGTFKSFPPTFISTGAAELLLSDSEMLYERMKSDGVDVTLSTKKHMPHNFTVYTTLFPESAAEMEKILQWTNTKLKQ